MIDAIPWTFSSLTSSVLLRLFYFVSLHNIGLAYMKKEYWLERWERADIGFHQSETNPYLRQYWQELRLPQSAEVFVPLCGKSRDMLWLREQGHSVLGVDLSPVAVQAFFQEGGLTARRIRSEKFDRWEGNGLAVLCGDFFDITKDDLQKISGVYDRASLVALPPEMRQYYASRLVSVLPYGTRILLIAFDYPQSEMQGPPFAVAESEVRRLYNDYAEISLLARLDVLEQNPRFQQRGLSRLQESIFLLKTHHRP